MQTGNEIPAGVVCCRDCKFYGVIEDGIKDCLNPYGLYLSKEWDFCSLAILKKEKERK